MSTVSESAWKWIDRLGKSNLVEGVVEKAEVADRPTHQPTRLQNRQPAHRAAVSSATTRVVRAVRATTSPPTQRTARVAVVPRQVVANVSPRNTLKRRPAAFSRAVPSKPLRATNLTESTKAVPSSDPVTRQMIDRDTLRLESRALFEGAIRYWKAMHADSWLSAPVAPCVTSPSVYIRKRPIFAKEIANREFDVISIQPHSVVTHNCLFHADLKRAYITHSTFGFTNCFDENATNETVFETTQMPQMCAQALSGATATVLMFGQTGSGKTHTMSAIEQLVASELFRQNSPQSAITVSFIELSGKKVVDLLVDDGGGVRLRERPDGSMLAEGALEKCVESSDQLAILMTAAHSRRHTESTGSNETSSRSHAICTIRVGTTGQLMLVDLAGSERRKDSMYHDRERQREGAAINASLHALKECVRWRTQKKSMAAPFRLSSLTRILARAFLDPNALLSVIATVSPCATDIEHTITTLRTVHLLAGQTPEAVLEQKQTQMKPPAEEVSTRLPAPKKWSPAQVADWIDREASARLPRGTTGAMLVRMPESRYVQLCNDERKGAKVYRALHELIAKSYPLQLSS